jgi:hypothetical protein
MNTQARMQNSSHYSQKKFKVLGNHNLGQSTHLLLLRALLIPPAISFRTITIGAVLVPAESASPGEFPGNILGARARGIQDKTRL